LIRKADIDDIPGILALVNQNLDKLLPRTPADYRELIDNTWVAEIEESNGRAIVGCATLEVYSSKIAEIRSVAVRQDLRSNGIGGQLVKAAASEARRRNIREVMVVTSTPKFFQELGFGACLDEKYALFLDGK